MRSSICRPCSPSQPFWLDKSRGLDWFAPPEVAYGPSSHSNSEVWFPNATLNVCFEALDRHCVSRESESVDSSSSRSCLHCIPAGHGHTAIPVSAETLSYGQVLDEVKILAGVLRHTLGVLKGDRVVIYMPMVAERAIAMLACARIGAIHVVVRGGAASLALAGWIDDVRPKALLATSCGLDAKGVVEYKPLIDAALAQTASPPQSLLLLRRTDIKSHVPPPVTQPYHPNSLIAFTSIPPLKIDNYRFPTPTHHFDWARECAVLPFAQRVDVCEIMRSEDIFCISYFSDSGALKGVVRLTGGYAVGMNYNARHVFGLKEGDTVFMTPGSEEVVGPSCALYTSLLKGCALVMCEDDSLISNMDIMWKTVDIYKVNTLITSPATFGAMQETDPHAVSLENYDLRSLGSIFLTGGRESDPSTSIKYLSNAFGDDVNVDSSYWLTEIEAPVSLSSTRSIQPCSKPTIFRLPGVDVRVVDDEGTELPRGQTGNIVLAPPLPPTALSGLWMKGSEYYETYWARFQKHGWFDTGDVAFIDEDVFGYAYLHTSSGTNEDVRRKNGKAKL